MFLCNKIIITNENKINRACYSALCPFGNKLRSEHIDEGRQALSLLRIDMNVPMEPAVSGHGLKSEGKKVRAITKF